MLGRHSGAALSYLPEEAFLLVLGLDSATPRESVALVRDGRLLAEVRLDTPDVASRRLLPSAVFLLESAGVTLAQLDGLAVAAGPGSFTGLRVGLGTAQGLALGAGLGCVGVSTLDALGRLGADSGTGLPVAALIDALRGEVYAALFDAGGAPLVAPRRDTLDGFLSEVPEQVLFVGDGAERHAAILDARFPRARRRVEPCFLAAEVARLGALRLERGEGVPPEGLRPFYLGEFHLRPAPATAT